MYLWCYPPREYNTRRLGRRLMSFRVVWNEPLGTLDERYDVEDPTTRYCNYQVPSTRFDPLCQYSRTCQSEESGVAPSPSLSLHSLQPPVLGCLHSASWPKILEPQKPASLRGGESGMVTAARPGGSGLHPSWLLSPVLLSHWTRLTP